MLAPLHQNLIYDLYRCSKKDALSGNNIPSNTANPQRCIVHVLSHALELWGFLVFKFGKSSNECRYREYIVLVVQCLLQNFAKMRRLIPGGANQRIYGIAGTVAVHIPF